ncbi:MAG: 30S ribosomal protein S8 [bacterium]
MIDPIADLLVRIRNASAVGKFEVKLPYSKMKVAILEIMKREGFLTNVEVLEEGNKKNISIVISQTKTPAHLRLISHQGQKIYAKKKEIRTPLRGLGLIIVSTPTGIITGREAIKRGVGGELICEIW